MLNIFYELKPFFEDVYREISVREYARVTGVSPPTASKRLNYYEDEDLLKSYRKGVYIYYRANKDAFAFKHLAMLYWYSILYPLTEKLHEKVSFQKIILFGSTIKAENTKDSDIDLFVDVQRREISTKLNKELDREVQFHFKAALKNKELKAAIREGVRIR